MKKNHALIIFALMAILFASYPPLALRAFYLDPAFRVDRDLPAHAISEMIEWEKKNDFLKPVPFSWEGVLYHLMHPFEADTREAKIQWVTRDRGRPSLGAPKELDTGTAWIINRQEGVAKFTITFGGIKLDKVMTEEEFKNSI